MEDQDSAIIACESIGSQGNSYPLVPAHVANFVTEARVFSSNQDQAGEQDLKMQIDFLQRQDPFISRILFVSTFTAVYEQVGKPENREQRKIDIEGSLYLLERTSSPLFKIFILNRKPREDFTDWIDDQTEFTDKDNFVAYTSRLPNNETRRRTLFFSVFEEKTRFIQEARKCIERMQDTSERFQVREALMRVVSDDKFLDYFIKLIKQKQGQPK